MAGVDADWQRFDDVFRGAVGRAQGQLCQLDVSQHDVPLHELLPVLTANAGSLRELHLRVVDDLWDSLSVEAVVAAAPHLQVLTVEDAHCSWEDAPLMLSTEPPFAVLQMRRGLNVSFNDPGIRVPGGMERVGPFAAALADATLQPALLRVEISGADMAQMAVMGALADAAVARRLRELTLWSCTPPAAAPLARLLAEGSLAVFEFSCVENDMPLFDAAGAALVADALRVNMTLTRLVLCGAGLCFDVVAVGAILGALVGHRTLYALHIFHEDAIDENRGALGVALAALIAADAPALLLLHCSIYNLGDIGLAPIFEALALNSHLCTLDVGRHNGMSEAFARERLLPAVRANTTLRLLTCANGLDDEPVPAAAEAEEMVRLRGQHA
jgi:hypothetical protein